MIEGMSSKQRYRYFVNNSDFVKKKSKNNGSFFRTHIFGSQWSWAMTCTFKFNVSVTLFDIHIICDFIIIWLLHLENLSQKYSCKFISWSRFNQILRAWRHCSQYF